MIMQIEEKKLYTLEEYLEFEVNSDTRHEYINGEIIPPHKWIFTEYSDAKSMISLSSIPFEIRLADLYENVLDA